MQSENDKSGIAGFLHGYKSKNIPTVETSISYHIGEIVELLKLIMRHVNMNDSAKSMLTRSLQLLEAPGNHLEKSVAFGQALNTLIDVHESALKSTDTELIKKVVYHFINIAKLSEDKVLHSLAIQIGGRF